MSGQHSNKIEIIAVHHDLNTKFIISISWTWTRIWMNVSSLNCFVYDRSNFFIIFCAGMIEFNLNWNTLKKNHIVNWNANINKENFIDIVNSEVIEENSNITIVSVKVWLSHYGINLSQILFLLSNYFFLSEYSKNLRAQYDDPSYNSSKKLNFTIGLLGEFRQCQFELIPTVKTRSSR